MILLDTADDIRWLKDTHLKGIKVPTFKSAVLHGNEDAPERIDLYNKRDPLHTDRPILVVTRSTLDAAWYRRHRNTAPITPSALTRRRGNPGGHQLRFDEYPLRDDRRKKSPPKYSFYQLTLDDVLSPDFGRQQLYTQDQQGFMARVRRNGKVRTWKRDPSRVEIPLKFGMYEAFRITDPSELFVMATDFPINTDPTPAETQDVVNRLTRRRGNPTLHFVESLAPNQTVVSHGKVVAFISYKTPVAVVEHNSNAAFVADKHYSNTTSRHLNAWLRSRDIDPRSVTRVHEEWIAEALQDGRLPHEDDNMAENPAGQLWYPGGVAIGRYKMGEAGMRYYVIPVESTHGWDFPTLVHMFPDNLRPDGLALVEARLGYEHSGQQGYHLFKVRVGGKWSRPLRLRTSLTEIPGVK